MPARILVKSEGNLEAELLEKEILSLKEELAQKGVEVETLTTKSLEFGGPGALIIWVVGVIGTYAITRVLDINFQYLL